jgi:hypothetical protein
LCTATCSRPTHSPLAPLQRGRTRSASPPSYSMRRTSAIDLSAIAAALLVLAAASAWTRSVARHVVRPPGKCRRPGGVERVDDLHHPVKWEPVAGKAGSSRVAHDRAVAGIARLDSSSHAHARAETAQSLGLGSQRVRLLVAPGLTTQRREPVGDVLPVSDAGRGVSTTEQFLGTRVALGASVGQEVQVGPANPPPARIATPSPRAVALRRGRSGQAGGRRPRRPTAPPRTAARARRGPPPDRTPAVSRATARRSTRRRPSAWDSQPSPCDRIGRPAGLGGVPSRRRARSWLFLRPVGRAATGEAGDRLETPAVGSRRSLMPRRAEDPRMCGGPAQLRGTTRTFTLRSST